jgi:hypothetical protein
MGMADNPNQVLCRDGAGGVYAGWEDARSGSTDIYLQHFTAEGTMAPGWPTGGLPSARIRPHSRIRESRAMAVAARSSCGRTGAVAAWRCGGSTSLPVGAQ